jgi:hypothetical protein
VAQTTLVVQKEVKASRINRRESLVDPLPDFPDKSEAGDCIPPCARIADGKLSYGFESAQAIPVFHLSVSILIQLI